MFGKNEVRKQDLRDDGFLRVQEIFTTIQGEGPLVGVPSVFLRLAGCNLRCTFCDTEFESNYSNLHSPADLLRMLDDARGTKLIGLLVITGGEPMIQNLIPLLKLVLESDQLPPWRVQIETAGTVWVPGLTELIAKVGRHRLMLVCSPKTPNVHEQVSFHCRHWKYVVRAGDCSKVDGLPVCSTQKYMYFHALYRPQLINDGDTVYLQPCDEQNVARNRDNQTAAIYLSMRYGYRLCLQIHKLVGLP